MPARCQRPKARRTALETTSARPCAYTASRPKALIGDPEVVRAAGRVIGVALDHERLTADLRVSRERLRESRARLVEAADSERRRIARDLHDGLQTRLVLLAIKANHVRAETTGPNGVRADAADLSTGIQTAIGELRELVHGVMPAALSERGLGAAAEELADSLPIPVALDVDLDGARLPGAVESAAYFVIAEAFANAIKHATASELRLRIGRTDGRLRVEVVDDGVGGAPFTDAGPSSGTGLRGMADRVEALDGQLIVDSPATGGTRILVEIPCAS
jgi:signal transduction histidine kinase